MTDKERALIISKTKSKYKGPWWDSDNDIIVAWGQLNEDILIVEFSQFHKCLEAALGRPVFTHEMGLARDSLIKELAGKCPQPTLNQIFELIPEDKRAVIVVS